MIILITVRKIMMNNNQKYVIDGKSNGVLRMIIPLVICAVFAVLAFDQFFGKKLYLGLMFLMVSISSLFIVVPLVVRYFFFKVCINESDFYIQTTPFNSKTYKYSEVGNARIELKSSRAENIDGPSQPVYFYYFYFEDADGKVHKFQFEKSIHEKEISVLLERINDN